MQQFVYGVATYIGLLVVALSCLSWAVFRMGKLAKTFEVQIQKIGALESAMGNLNSIPDLKAGIEMLNARIARDNDWAREQFAKQNSKFLDLRTEIAIIKGRVGLGLPLKEGE